MPISIPPKKPDVPMPPVDQCIYCGTKDPFPLARFTDEHIFPEGLGGNLVLPRASCEDCQETINKEIENPFMRKIWGNFRLKHNFPSKSAKKKRKDDRATWVEVGTRSGGKMRIPISDFPVPALVLRYGTADVLADGVSRGPDREGASMIAGVDPQDIAACIAKYPDWDEALPVQGDGRVFARLIAKIGYAFAAGHAGTSWFREWVTPLIRGIDDDYGRIVGGDAEGYESMNVQDAPGSELGIRMFVRRTSESRGLVIVEVDFFAEPHLPHYHVVLGECDLGVNPVTNSYTWSTSPEALVAGGHVAIERDRSQMQAWLFTGAPRPMVRPPENKPPSMPVINGVLPGLPDGPALS